MGDLAEKHAVDTSVCRPPPTTTRNGAVTTPARPRQRACSPPGGDRHGVAVDGADVLVAETAADVTATQAAGIDRMREMLG
jgi:hypothetical protein